MAANKKLLFAFRSLFFTSSLFFYPITEAKIERNRYVIAEFKRQQPCPSNGNKYGPCPGWQIDHVIPLKCGGPDRPDNMQWLTVVDHKAKTRREIRWCVRPRSSLIE